MVNEVVLNYLKENLGKYSQQDLKNKILSGGYSEGEYNEALNLVNSPQPSVETKIDSPFVREDKEGFKWIRFAGISGIIIFVLMVFLMVFSFVYNFQKIYSHENKINLLAFMLYFVIIIALQIFTSFFIYGFVKIAINTESKILKFSSLVFFALAIFSIMCLILFSIWVFVDPQIMMITGSAIAENVSNPVNLEYSYQYSRNAWSFFGLSSVMWILLILIFFFIGLLKIEKKVKYAKISGILGLTWILFSIILFIVMLFILPLITPLILSGNLNFLVIIFWILGGIYSLLVIADFIFLILSLFDASEKFE
jgi:hypothetical protein